MIINENDYGFSAIIVDHNCDCYDYSFEASVCPFGSDLLISILINQTAVGWECVVESRRLRGLV